MISFLNNPFPSFVSRKENFYTALLCGIFVSSFLLLFQPFGISESSEDHSILKSVGFGFVSFFVLMFHYFIIPKIFPRFYEEKEYTIGKDLLSSAFMIFLIAIANGFYAQLFTDEAVFANFCIMIYQTILIGIFPITVLVLLQYNRLLKMNLKVSKEIKLPETTLVSKLNNRNDQYYFISGEQEQAKVSLNDFLYLESEGNYANLNQLINGIQSKSLHRATLKSIEAENKHKNIIRCHRSFIVNLDQVKEVSGNAQGLKLTLNNCDELIPVSRKYIAIVKSYFASN